MNKIYIWAGGLLAAAFAAYFLFFRKKEVAAAEREPALSLGQDDWDAMKAEFSAGNPYEDNKFDTVDSQSPETWAAMKKKLQEIVKRENGGRSVYFSDYEMNNAFRMAPIDENFSMRSADLEPEDLPEINAIFITPSWHPHGGQKRVETSRFNQIVYSRIRELLQEKNKAYTLGLLDDRFSAAGGLSRMPASYIGTPAAALAAQARAETAAKYYYKDGGNTTNAQ